MKHVTAIAIVFSVILAGSTIAQENDRQKGQRQRPAPFQQFFTLPGVEFSAEQQSKIEQLRKEFVPKLSENQDQWNSIITKEQQQARREAFQKAQDAGKQGRELRAVADAAIEFTDEQKKQRASIQDERNELVSEIRTQLTALLTDEQRARVRQPRRVQQQITPTHADVKYGPYERNVMDVWLAKSDEPTPVLVSIHGGGFRGGNKSVSGELLRQSLDSGISVVAIININHVAAESLIFNSPFDDNELLIVGNYKRFVRRRWRGKANDNVLWRGVEPCELELQRYSKHVHIGPYHELPQKWQALKAELSARGETVTMPSLEVYGHSCEGDDDSKAKTTILMGLKPKEA